MLSLSKSIRPLLIGLLFPIGFAPFHFPGLSLLSLLLFFLLIQSISAKQALRDGFLFGFGAFGFGVSWVYVSIHAYGHLNAALSVIITLCFIAYLSCFTALFAFTFNWLKQRLGLPKLQSAFAFSSLWTLFEYARATLFTGFPWLLLGQGQFDSPLRAFLPLIGTYGTGFIACFSAVCFAQVLTATRFKRLPWLITALACMLAPLLFQNHSWTAPSTTPLTVGMVQSNLSMREKWDESLFWSILHHYEEKIQTLLHNELIVLPESAIPLPEQYLTDALNEMNERLKASKAALIYGIPVMQAGKNPRFYNGLSTLGEAKGEYLKQHLVPFGEYVPRPFLAITSLLGIPDPSLTPGPLHQALVQIQHQPIATLICYELAYSELLRAQLPEAQWIVSISDDGWFGRSLAMYQQLQMAQIRSLQSGRYQLVSNNDGGSAVLNAQGKIIASLPAHQAGTLEAKIYPMTGLTPWATWGDGPILMIVALILCISFLHQRLPATIIKRYPCQPN